MYRSMREFVHLVEETIAQMRECTIWTRSRVTAKYTRQINMITWVCVIYICIYVYISMKFIAIVCTFHQLQYWHLVALIYHSFCKYASSMKSIASPHRLSPWWPQSADRDGLEPKQTIWDFDPVITCASQGEAAKDFYFFFQTFYSGEHLLKDEHCYFHSCCFLFFLNIDSVSTSYDSTHCK